MNGIYITSKDFNHKIFPAIFLVLFTTVYYKTEMQKIFLEKILEDLEIDLDIEKFLLYQVSVLFYGFEQVFDFSYIIKIEEEIFKAMYKKRKELKNIIGQGVLSQEFEKKILLDLEKKFFVVESDEKAAWIVLTQIQLSEIHPSLNVLSDYKGK